MMVRENSDGVAHKLLATKIKGNNLHRVPLIKVYHMGNNKSIANIKLFLENSSPQALIQSYFLQIWKLLKLSSVVLQLWPFFR